jgi:hypothetical protein
MADDLIVEILDQNWLRKAATNRATSVRLTEELGQVGDGRIEIPVDDIATSFLPNPDATNPYEGRFRVYEDDDLQFAGVIDARTITISPDGANVQFGGKHRGVTVGFYNTGRVDYLGWNVQELMRELLRNNIAKEATLHDVSTQEDLYQAYQMVTGDPFKQNYWKTTSATPTHYAVFDLGTVRTIDAIRVMPQWWKDLDTGKFHYHNFVVSTSNDASSWTARGTKTGGYPSSGKGHLYELTGVSARYVRLEVTGSTDGYARIAQLMVYQNIAEIGNDTTFTVPFIENDDSGNCTTAGSPERPIVPGAFQGDGVITHSYVTKLVSSGQSITHTFRGVSNAVFFTSHTDGGGTAGIYVDGNLRDTITIPNGRYWFKGYDTLDDFGAPLSDTLHTLEVRWASGVVQVDYFNGLYQTSWRPIEDDDPSLAYLGNWFSAEAAYYHNYFSAVSEDTGNELTYTFTGDAIRIIGSKGPGFGSFNWALAPGGPSGTVNCSDATTSHKQVLLDVSGLTFGEWMLVVDPTSTSRVAIDRLEGNFTHTLYMRARYEANLKVLVRMSEIIDSYLRFNHDGTVDLVGAVGDPSGTAIIEGTNEGGTVVQASVEDDYQETGSAVLAIVNVNGEFPIKAFVIDKEAVAEIGFKVIKLEQSDAADQFLLNRQALQYLREKRKPTRSYNVSYDPDEVGEILVGQTTRLYSPTTGLDGRPQSVGKITTEYVKD